MENHCIGETIDSNGDGQIDHQTRFAYDGNQIVLQFDKDVSGATGSASALTGADLSHRYLWQPDVVDQLLADEQLSPLPPGEGQGEGSNGQAAGYDLTTPGKVLWALNDQLGTIRDLASLDSQTGITTVADHRTYSAFGEMTSQTNAAVDCLFGFTGKPVDNNTGLRSHWNRWTDPRTSDWLSKDPLGFMAGDTNTVRYVGNRVTTSTDPSGLQGWNSQEVVEWLKQIAPNLAGFWQKPGHGVIVGGAQDRGLFGRMFHPFDGPAPSVKVTGWVNLANNLAVDPTEYPGIAQQVTATVPDDWTSLQVATFIAGQVASNGTLTRAIGKSVGSSGFDLEMGTVAGCNAEFSVACGKIGAVLQAGVTVAVACIPGGGGLFALLVSDIAEGAFVNALFDALPLLPVEKIGSVALRFIFDGGKEVEVSAPVVKVLYEMTDAEKATLKLELAGKTADQIESILAKIPKGEWVSESTAGWSARAIAYQEQITGRTAGQAFRVNGVRFDGYNGISLVDAKGPGYANLLNYGLGEAKLLKEATSQVIAAQGAHDHMVCCGAGRRDCDQQDTCE